MQQNKIESADPLGKVRVGIIAELDPADDYTAVIIDVPLQREELSPDEARELARMLTKCADLAEL